MRVSDFLKPVAGRKPKKIRVGASYRAVRREAAKIEYREAKRRK